MAQTLGHWIELEAEEEGGGGSMRVIHKYKSVCTVTHTIGCA